MSNPTSNYGFVMPTPTDLVTDLPADFEVFGQDVDSQMKTNADAATQKATLTTTGDIYYASAASTPARLGVGTTGQVLTVAGGVPSWAAPFSAATLTEIATGTLSGASVTVSSLSNYDTLILAVYSTTNNTAAGITKIRVNNNSGSNYAQFGFYTDQPYRVTGNDAVFINPNTLDRAVNANAAIIKFTNCKAAGFTDFDLSSMIYTGSNQVASLAGVYKVAEAVSSLVILNTGGNWAGGTYTVWGG